MDFWTAIADVSGIITIATAAWQVGKAIFKKNSIDLSNRRKAVNSFRNPLALFKKRESPSVCTPRDSSVSEWLDVLAGRKIDFFCLTHPDSDHIPAILLAPHHGSKKTF